jgi:hypothetical protein
MPGKYRFIAAGFPYEFLTTKSIKVSTGDIIKF